MARGRFLRIHRSLLVSMAHMEEVRTDAGRCTVLVDGTELAVSRRHTRALRELLVRRARPGTRRDRLLERAAAPGAGHQPAHRGTTHPFPLGALGDRRETQLGEVYMRSLMRSQLRLALGVLRRSSRHGRACCRCCSRIAPASAR